MSTLEFLQMVSTSVLSSHGREKGFVKDSVQGSARDTFKLWMVLDAITILGASILATIIEFHKRPETGAMGFWRGTLIHGRSLWILPALLCWFAITLMITNSKLHLYSPMRAASILHEQKLSAEACFISGLLLTGTLYLIHGDDIPRSVVLITIGMVTILLGLRRLLYRFLLYRRFDRGVGTRNVLIVGTEPKAHALRRRLERTPHLGYTFKGFIELRGSGSSLTAASGEVAGTLETVFEHTRRQYVDEIFFTLPCEREILQDVLEQARAQGVDLRVIPEMYHDLAGESSIEYIGEFPTMLFQSGQASEFALFFKRVFDIVFSSAVLIIISPLLLAIAIAVKLDSPGPVFYSSARIGKKGRAFRCIKFRTMVRDAEIRRAEVMHLNERDGVLFKITNDPRITRLGRFLRKYSLDELPQFFNVLRSEMSVVGPRPPLADEVKKYELGHLRRLDVTPGVTGLWQVQARQDPSFDSYVSLDMMYIENWSLWLDFKIVLRTIGVVFAGTGL